MLIRSRFVALKGRLSDYQLYVRFDPTLNGNGGGGDRQRRRRRRRASRRRRPHAARRLRHRDRRPTRPTATTRCPSTPRSTSTGGFDAGHQRLRRAAPATGSTQLDDAPRADATCTTRPRTATSSRPGASPLGRDGDVHARARLRRHAGHARSPRRSARCTTASATRASDYARGWHALRRRARQAAAPARRLGLALERPARRVLPQRQLRQGGRGQDVPRRRRRRAGLAVGPGGLGRRPGQHLLRLLPRGLRARPLRGVDGGLPGRRPPDRDGHDALPVRAPAAARRLDAAQQPAPTASSRPTASTRSSTSAPTRWSWRSPSG